MLTDAERRWVKRLNKVLADCPSPDIGFYTIGDPDITLYRIPDGDFVDDENVEFVTAVADSVIGTALFPNAVHGVRG